MSLARDWLAEFRVLSMSTDANAKSTKNVKRPEPDGRAKSFDELARFGEGLQEEGSPAPVHAGMIGTRYGRSAIFEPVAGVLWIWTEGVARLGSTERRNGYTARRWSQLLVDASAFIETWAVQAAALGWSTLDIFGVHPQAPEVQQDCKGLLPSIDGAAIVAITADAAWLRIVGGTIRIYYRRPRFRTIPVWELSAIAE